MEQELKPCPMCGSTRIADNMYIRDGSETECEDCGVRVHAFNPDSREKANDKWNTRTPSCRELRLEAALKWVLDDVQEWCECVERDSSWDSWDSCFKSFHYKGGIAKARAALESK